MPFWKHKSNFQPLWKEWEIKAKINGLRKSIFNPQNEVYVGEWKDNKKHGNGSFKTSDKLYEGEWENDCRQGHGILCHKLENGTYEFIYQGYWHNNKRQGMGWNYYINGDIYGGQWENGRREGFGKMWYKDGAFYIGTWLDDLRHGAGVFIKANGNIYEGNFENGVQRGQGMLHHINAKSKQKGTWGYGSGVTTEIIFRRPKTSKNEMDSDENMKLKRCKSVLMQRLIMEQEKKKLMI